MVLVLPEALSGACGGRVHRLAKVVRMCRPVAFPHVRPVKGLQEWRLEREELARGIVGCGTGVMGGVR